MKYSERKTYEKQRFIENESCTRGNLHEHLTPDTSAALADLCSRTGHSPSRTGRGPLHRDIRHSSRTQARIVACSAESLVAVEGNVVVQSNLSREQVGYGRAHVTQAQAESKRTHTMAEARLRVLCHIDTVGTPIVQFSPRDTVVRMVLVIFVCSEWKIPVWISVSSCCLHFSVVVALIR